MVDHMEWLSLLILQRRRAFSQQNRFKFHVVIDYWIFGKWGNMELFVASRRSASATLQNIITKIVLKDF